MSRPTRIRLRVWQREALDRFELSDGIDFLAVATPGAGKTTFALAALVQDLADHAGRRAIVVAPTQHLKSQWARAASRFGLHLDPEWSARDGELPSDMHGIVTTYQQVATSSAALARLARGAFVVLDEIHHAGDDRSWGSAVAEAFGGAGRRLSLSGTPFRSDSAAIPFVEYHLDVARPDYEYGYGEALSDGGVVRPVYFPRIDGFMEWTAHDGEVVAATFADDLTRERSNQRLRTALSLEGEWLPSVIDAAHDRLAELRREDPAAGGLVIATDQQHARGIADLLARRHRVRPVVAVSEDPDASARIAAFAESDDPWIVAVRMVSEGVDVPRLRLGVFATTTTTELFFRQAVGRVVRYTSGTPRQRAYFFVPDDPRLRHHAAELAELRRHSLRKARGTDEEIATPSADPDDVPLLGDEEQMSLFAVIGAVSLGESGTEGSGAGPVEAPGVFGSVDDVIPSSIDGVDLILLPPPLPGGRVPVDDRSSERPDDGRTEGLTLRQRKAAARDANADIAAELVRATGWSHPQVNAELNRLSGVRKVSEATLDQLEARLAQGNRWLRGFR